MKAIVYERYGPPEVLRLVEIPRPEPGDGDVVVRVLASVVGPADCAARKARPFYARLAFGLFRPRARVLGDLVAGEVAAVGGQVRTVREGEQVVAVTGMAFGAHAEYVRLPADGVVARPAGVAPDDAVAVVEGGLTALPFLRDHAGVRPGQHVLVNGASGSVGTAAVQLAKHLGATVTGVCGAGNADLVASLGADEVIDYGRDDFTRARAAYDVIFDAVGTSTYARCRAALKPGGVYLTTVPTLAAGVATGWTARFGRTRAVLAFTGLRKAADKAADMAYLLALAESGALRPVVDRRYPLERVPEAHRYVDTARKRGAAVVTPGTAVARGDRERGDRKGDE
jgi:NADPH:quinone reductase-like Zn-dependent oxidoreductase